LKDRTAWNEESSECLLETCWKQQKTKEDLWAEPIQPQYCAVKLPAHKVKGNGGNVNSQLKG